MPAAVGLDNFLTMSCTRTDALSSGLGQGGEPSVKLAPGQETSVQVSFGRKDNVVGNITVGRQCVGCHKTSYSLSKEGLITHPSRAGMVEVVGSDREAIAPVTPTALFHANDLRRSSEIVAVAPPSGGVDGDVGCLWS